MVNTAYVPSLARTIRPLTDRHWDKFVLSHPRSSVFHTSAWLRTLQQTYGYEPIAFSTIPPGTDSANAFVFCRIDSWLTGRRLVSLPFSDYCEPLVDNLADGNAIIGAIAQELSLNRLSYAELRPTASLRYSTRMFLSERRYCHHQIDLQPDLSTIFTNCHKDSIQRKIRRAERDGITYEEGRSELLLLAFYRLWLLTRRRHLIPPQPEVWFRNLTRSFGEAAKIRVAFKGGRAIAAIITLQYKRNLLYKYGCSDAKYHNLGGMHMLLWTSIQEAKAAGMNTFDLGRSDPEGEGLIRFKDRWGAARSELVYSRLVLSPNSNASYKSRIHGWKETITRKLLSRLPDRLFRSAGTFLYPHIG